MRTQSKTRIAVAAAFAAALVMVGPAFAQVGVPALPSEVSATAPFQPIATVYQEDFEFSDGGFVVGGSASWEHGTPVNPPTAAPGQGPAMWGTNLAGDYANGECGWIQSPPVDLSAYPAGASTGVHLARLAFAHWMFTERRFDAGVVMASSDGDTWSVLTPIGGYDAVPFTTARNCFGLDTTGTAYTSSSTTAPGDDEWRFGEFDVSAYLGGAMHLRWVFASDASVVKRGWYVDDVIVQVGAGGAVGAALPQGPEGIEAPFTAAATLYAEDFEGSDGGWSASGSWQWGAPASPPATLPGSLNVWGTQLLGDYDVNDCSYLTSPGIALPAAGAESAATIARLSFKMWRYTENGYDAARLLASADGGATWFGLTPDAGYDRNLNSFGTAGVQACLGVPSGAPVWSGPSVAPKEDEWMDVVVDLTPHMGSTLMLRVAFASDGDTVRRGVYVDDVLVQLGAGAATGVPAPGDVNGLETPAPDWTVTGTNPSWQHGLPTSGPFSLRPVFATSLAGNYNANECSAIESSAIDTNAVPGLGRLELTFEHYFRGYSSLDGGVVQVTNDDGATWTTVTPVGGYNGALGTNARACIAPGVTSMQGFVNDATGSDYESRTVNLNSWLGDTIRVRFVFGSSASGQDDGWTVRAVALTRGLASVPVGTAETAGGFDALLEKADPELRRALGEGVAADVEAIVAVKPLVGIADEDFATRAEAIAWLEEKAAPTLDMLEATAQLAGADVLASWASVPAIKVRGSADALALLAQRDEVTHVVLDHDEAVHLIEPIPDDTVGASNTQGRNMLQAEDIWALGYKGAGITVTVIDTGIDPSHEAFKYADGSSRVAAFADCQSGGCIVGPGYDNHGHGTHVAGTAVGSALYNDPTYGYFQETGVAPEATLKVAKFLSGSGSGSFQAAIDSLNWAFAQNSDLTSNSWGASGCSSSAYPVMAAVRTLTDAGMLSVFAAGNSGSGSGTIGSPGCSESALTVGAVDASYNIASFSSRGPCADNEIGAPSRICPDVVAKGVAVRSAIPRSGAGNADPSGYKTWQGTSMATPHIAGAVILAEQMKRDLTGSGWDTAARAEEEVFKLTALDLGAAGEDNTFGWGHPQLLTVYALLDSTDEARLIDTFGITNAVVRQGDSTTMSFGVRNLGGAIVTGTFSASLTDPNGATVHAVESSETLGLLDGASAAHTFSVTGDAPPGTYTWSGAFDYSWTNSTSGEVVTGTIARSGVFDVKRVFVEMELAGWDAVAAPGDLQEVVMTATNTGNEDALNVVLEFTVPDDYVFVPGDNFDPQNDRSRYGSPAPDAVREDKNFGRVTLVYNVGSLPQGDSFSFATKLLPTLPGEYRALSVVKFRDGGDNGFSQGKIHAQSVALPTMS